MKSQGDVVQKLKQVQFRHSKKEIERLLSRNPRNCKFNRSLEVKGFGEIGFCTCSRIGLKACDALSPLLNRAASQCPEFSLILDEEGAREQVKAFFRDSSPAEIASKYPDAAALMWALDGEVVNPPDPYLIKGPDILLWASCQEDVPKVEGLFKKLHSLEGRVLELQAKNSALHKSCEILEISLRSAKSDLVKSSPEIPKPGLFRSLLLILGFAIGMGREKSK